MVLSYALCNTATASVRREPFHYAEQVTELLFGEKVEVLWINERDWAKVRVEWDGYEGWCKAGQLAMVSKKDYRKACKYMAASHTDKLTFEDEEMPVPMGSDMYGSKITVCKKEAKFKGKKLYMEDTERKPEQLIKAAKQYLNAPYLWGGRSVWGIDCSGLVQMAFKLCGMTILRDAAQQATQGETVDFLQHAKCGDLAFFDNEEGKITHVGILIDNQTIIHAADGNGRVAIDKIDQGGIVSTILRKRTHNLRVVKRFF